MSGWKGWSLEFVAADPPTLARLHSIHLLNPNAIIQDSGNAAGEILSVINNLNHPKEIHLVSDLLNPLPIDAPLAV